MAMLTIGRSPGHPRVAGEQVLCEQGHHVCDVILDTDKAPPNAWDKCFGNWQQEAPVAGKTLMPIRCEECGSVALL